MGTPEGDEIKDPSSKSLGLSLVVWSNSHGSTGIEYLPDVLNDLDFDFGNENLIDAFAKYQQDQRNVRKVKEASDKLNVNIIHPLREGKKLLVLDIDYSAFSTCSYLIITTILSQLFLIRSHSPLELCHQMNVLDRIYMNFWKHCTHIMTVCRDVLPILRWLISSLLLSMCMVRFKLFCLAIKG